MILLLNQAFGFVGTIILRLVWPFLATPSTCLISSIAILVVPIFLTFRILYECGDILFHPFKVVSNFYFLGNYGYIKVKIYVCISSPFFNLYPVTHSFYKAICISSDVTKDNSLFLTTPFEMLSL